jgi:hypothetical protein
MSGVQETHVPGTAPATRMVAPARAEQASPPAGPKLLDRLQEALRSRHYSHRTKQTYCHWVRQSIVFRHVRRPADMAETEINAFLTHLAVKEKVSASTQNQALSALLFLYWDAIGQEVGDAGEVIRARRLTRLPAVMTREEVKAVLGQLTGDKWLVASLVYGRGIPSPRNSCKAVTISGPCSNSSATRT